MAADATFRAVGDWNAQIRIPLTSAIQATMDVFGKSAEKTCRTAIWFMAQSAAKLTKIAVKSREVVRNPSFRHYIKKEQYKQIAMRDGPDALKPYYAWTATKLMQGGKWKPIFANSKAVIARIKSRGLGRRSWGWSFGKGKPIDGVTQMYSLVGKDRGPYMSDNMTVGYVLRNRLDYITKALPAGWEQDVESKASNKLMAQAAKKMEYDFGLVCARLHKN